MFKNNITLVIDSILYLKPIHVKNADKNSA